MSFYIVVSFLAHPQNLFDHKFVRLQKTLTKKMKHLLSRRFECQFHI